MCPHPLQVFLPFSGDKAELKRGTTGADLIEEEISWLAHVERQPEWVRFAVRCDGLYTATYVVFNVSHDVTARGGPVRVKRLFLKKNVGLDSSEESSVGVGLDSSVGEERASLEAELRRSLLPRRGDFGKSRVGKLSGRSTVFARFGKQASPPHFDVKMVLNRDGRTVLHLPWTVGVVFFYVSSAPASLVYQDTMFPSENGDSPSLSVGVTPFTKRHAGVTHQPATLRRIPPSRRLVDGSEQRESKIPKEEGRSREVKRNRDRLRRIQQ
eukprot:Selendium_serpulae@DN11527_c0_g1_i1.p1